VDNKRGRRRARPSFLHLSRSPDINLASKECQPKYCSQIAADEAARVYQGPSCGLSLTEGEVAFCVPGETKRAQSLAVGTCPRALPLVLVLSDEKESAGYQPALLVSGRELEGARQTGMRTRDGPRAYSIIMCGPRELWCDLGVLRGAREWRQVKYGSLPG
jgi:hypothetical protein